MHPLLADHNFNGIVVRGVRIRAAAAGFSIDIITAAEAGIERLNDVALLEWAADSDRIVVTGDVQTLLGFAKKRVDGGMKMPGVFAVRWNAPLARVIEDVLMLAVVAEPGEYESVIDYLPF